MFKFETVDFSEWLWRSDKFLLRLSVVKRILLLVTMLMLTVNTWLFSCLIRTLFTHFCHKAIIALREKSPLFNKRTCRVKNWYSKAWSMSTHHKNNEVWLLKNKHLLRKEIPQLHLIHPPKWVPTFFFFFLLQVKIPRTFYLEQRGN